LERFVGATAEVDQDTVITVTETILGEIRRRATAGEPLNFEIPGFATVCISDEGRVGSGASVPSMSSEAELRRILPKLVTDAFTQLPSDAAGIVIVRTPAQLDEEFTTTMLRGLLASPQRKAKHISGVFFFPVYQALMQPWALFHPFSVTNEQAAVPATSVKAFHDLSQLLDVDILSPRQPSQTS
jgi:hypothetical protein